jgi:hypothetical protein
VKLLVPFGMFFSVNLDCLGVMPRRVVDLYACWWTVGSTHSATMEDGTFVPFVVSMKGKE